jgi:bifunctional non-homologous end joining protein LigD
LRERKQPPDGRDWRYELKLDGFRAIGRKVGRSTQLWSRDQKDFTRRFPRVVRGIAEHPAILCRRAKSQRSMKTENPRSPCFRASAGPQAIVDYAVDLPMLCGNVRLWPLDERREQHRDVVQSLPDTVRYSEMFKVRLSELMLAVRKHQFDGMVAKGDGTQYLSAGDAGV